MRHPIRSTALAAGACVALSLQAVAQRPPDRGYSSAEVWFRSIVVNGFAEGSYSYNANDPDSGRNTLRVFDFDDREIKLDVFELVAQRPIKERGEVGFRLDGVYGQSIPEVTASSGLFRGVGDGKAEDYDLQQGYLSWIAPLGSGLRIDAGKFVSPFGYEVIQGYDGYNDNQTRSFLFGFAIPHTHTGARASYAFADAFTATVMAVQGWDVFHDNNDAKSFGAQLAFKPMADWSIELTAMSGAEQRKNDSSDRSLVGLTTSLKTNEWITLGLEGVYGEEEDSVLNPSTLNIVDSSWSGAAGYFRCDLSKSASVSLRYERFEDGDGARTGTAQTLQSFTLTPEFKLGDNTFLRGDLRQDWSDEDVFEDGSGLSGDQLTASVGLFVTI